MIIHPRGKPHMNITDLFYFCIPGKVLLSSLEYKKKNIVSNFKITWMKEITKVASYHVLQL